MCTYVRRPWGFAEGQAPIAQAATSPIGCSGRATTARQKASLGAKVTLKLTDFFSAPCTYQLDVSVLDWEFYAWSDDAHFIHPFLEF